MDCFRSVAVIDDDVDVRGSLAAFVESLDLAIQTFTSAEDFLLRRHPPVACVVSDYRMPGLNGLELLRLMRSTGETMPFIISTAFADNGLAIDAALYNATVIQFPNGIGELAACLYRIMKIECI